MSLKTHHVESLQLRLAERLAKGGMKHDDALTHAMGLGQEELYKRLGMNAGKATAKKMVNSWSGVAGSPTFHKTGAFWGGFEKAAAGDPRVVRGGAEMLQKTIERAKGHDPRVVRGGSDMLQKMIEKAKKRKS